MNIIVTSGVGVGQTLLSSFDAALKDAGVYNYNLIVLSSIIPVSSKIKARKFLTPLEEYGHKLYVIKAELRSRQVGKYIGAALGWYQLEDGRGVFVEHEEIEDTREGVKLGLTKSVHNSLIDLCKLRSLPIKEDHFKMEMKIAKVVDAPTTVLVLAVYKSEGWET